MKSKNTSCAVITEHWQKSSSWRLNNFKNGRYTAVDRALQLGRNRCLKEIEESGLRGRGGAGFPTHIKMSALYKSNDIEKYLVVNADESEPGACKDIPIMLYSPHLLLEGALISAYVAGAKTIYIYLRGEVLTVAKQLIAAIKEAYSAAYFGKVLKDSYGETFTIECHLHIGAGAYICGEETAMLESIEGYRGQPRLKNILPVFSGLFQKPTLINNVETIASLPGIIENGNKWFRSMGTKLSPGHGLYSVSGHVKKPGQYEYGLGVSFRELLERCGGIRDGRKLKFWSPGGASTSIFTEEHMDVELSYEGVASSGSMLGTRSIQVFDDTVCVVWAIARWMEFYKHESCGKCTPCREGTFWMKLLYDRLEDGRGTMDDIERLSTICNNVAARGFCAFIDGAILPVLSSLKYFYDEYQAHVLNKGCNYNLTSSLALKDEDLRIPST